MLIFLNLNDLIIQLYQGKVIVYPTESVFGLGCDPDNKYAVDALLRIKHRSWKKGLILIASNYTQLYKYINYKNLNKQQRSCIFSSWPGPVTWLLPANISSPYWLTGQSNFLAVRVVDFKPIRDLCDAFGKPLISTSANLFGYQPARTIQDIFDQFGSYGLPIMRGEVLGNSSPSKIIDVVTKTFIRK